MASGHDNSQVFSTLKFAEAQKAIECIHSCGLLAKKVQKNSRNFTTTKKTGGSPRNFCFTAKKREKWRVDFSDGVPDFSWVI